MAEEQRSLSRCDEEDIGYSVSGDLINVRVGGSTHSRTIREWHALSVASFVTSERGRAKHSCANCKTEQLVSWGCYQCGQTNDA